MPDMNDLPQAPESAAPEAAIERINQLRAELERLRTLRRRLEEEDDA